jgi:hypothetical protein
LQTILLQRNGQLIDEVKIKILRRRTVHDFHGSRIIFQNKYETCQ